jgi:large subunit ribosomal protein L2
MPVKRYKPTTPARRFRTVFTYSEITKKTPEKSLVVPNPHSGGRNHNGRRTAVNTAGGNKTQYRLVDFKRENDGIPGKVAAIEYDPNRSARIALIHFANGDKRYIIWPVGLSVGDTVQAGAGADIKPGNALPLGLIPVGTTIHNIELNPGRGAKLVRSAGGFAQLQAKEGKYATIRMPSSEMRIVLLECKATIGQVGNLEHENIKHGKAGKLRWKGVYMHNRGVVMSPRDHPHGGGEAKSPVGRKKGPCSNTGVLAIGFRTRHNKSTDKYRVRRRGGR